MIPDDLQLPRVRALLAAHAFRPALWGEHTLDVLSVLAQTRRSGLLVVRGSDGTERALALVDGDVTWAASTEPSEAYSASETVFGLVRLTDGDFTFLRAPPGVLPDADPVSLQHLLLDGLRRADEASRSPGRAAG